jgi:eukaryotic-like serine/threonine-protein kinase
MDMSPATWNALSRLLDHALDLDPPQREAWVDGLSVDNPELVPLLRKLLAAHASHETDDVLERLPSIGAEVRSPIEGVGAGALVGPYRLKRELASGGMADVWLAERADGAFEREVALKLPRLTRLRRDLEVRFAHERDILARLEHPHIARFYDAGVTQDGLPYLAMEYVDGQPITQWCDEHKLDVAARLRLFAQVLDAVKFAHANLVIHRDLKPSNMLVTADAQVRLLDFGIAKLLSDGEMARETQLTQFAGRALTPEYASPEQIRGEPLTTATDVYSLGVVLYELLTGQRPYQLKLQSAAQLEQAILTVDPPRPSSVVSAEVAAARGTSESRFARALKGDLDTVVLEALAKEPAQRYATIAEFADDLRRHLAGQTVHARPASWSYRARKFIQRNRLAVGAAAAIGVALITASIISLWQAQRAAEQARIAELQANRADEVKQFVLSFFESSDIEQGGTRQTTAVDLLKQARERLDTAPIADDATRVELLTTIGDGLFGLGDVELSASVLKEATSLAAAKLSDRDQIMAKAQSVYGFVLYVRGELEPALQQFDAAEARSRRTGDMAILASVLRGKALVHDARDQVDIALDLSSEAIRAAEQQKPPVDKEELITAYMLAADLRTANRRKGALEPASRAYMLARERYHDRPTGLLLATRSSYASALAKEGNPEVALAELRALLRQQIEILGKDHQDVASALSRMADASLRLGDPASALASYTEVFRIRSAKAADKPTGHVGRARVYLGDALANAHRYDEALAEYREATATLSAALGADNEYARVARSGVGLALAKLGRLDEADAIFAKLLEQPFSEPRLEGMFKVSLGQLRSAEGRHDEALALLRVAPDFYTDAPNERPRALALASLGYAMVAAGRAEEALGVLQEARTLLLKDQRNGSPDLADIALNMARAQLALGRADQAVPLAEDAVAYWSRFAPQQRDTGIALLWHARALAAAGQSTKAFESLRQASAILAKTGLPADRTLVKEAQKEVPKARLAGASH